MLDFTRQSIFVAGHRGLVGSAIVRSLERRGARHLILKTRQELDLANQSQVDAFFRREKPELVFLAAAKVGGIGANSSLPGEFIYENLAIAVNVIHAAKAVGVQKLLNLGSTCIYPRLAPQPIPEESLLSGPLEDTNRPYAVAKIAAIELCDAYRRQYGCDFISAMPTNLYGPGDNFDLAHAHVLPALMRRFDLAKDHSAPQVSVWGSGRPLREFLYVDDLAEACLFLMERYSEPGPINVGSGEEVSIAALAELIRQTVDFQGQLTWDATRPDGTPRKLCSVSRLHALGFRAATPLRRGLEMTYQWYLENKHRLRGEA